MIIYGQNEIFFIVSTIFVNFLLNCFDYIFFLNLFYCLFFFLPLKIWDIRYDGVIGLRGAIGLPCCVGRETGRSWDKSVPDLPKWRTFKNQKRKLFDWRDGHFEVNKTLVCVQVPKVDKDNSFEQVVGLVPKIELSSLGSDPKNDCWMEMRSLL